LPVPVEHRALAVDLQEECENSVLNAYRTFLQWRKQHAVLKFGSLEFFDSEADVLCFTRAYQGKVMRMYFNLSAEPSEVSLPSGQNLQSVAGHGFENLSADGDTLSLPPFGAFFAEHT